MINPKRVTLELARSFLGNHPRDPELQRVVDHIERRAPISKDVGEISEAEESFWDRLANSVANWWLLALHRRLLSVLAGLDGDKQYSPRQGQRI